MPKKKSNEEFLEALEERQRELNNETKAFLSSNGWEYSCEVGALWLWKREVDGRLIFVNESTALHLTSDGWL